MSCYSSQLISSFCSHLKVHTMISIMDETWGQYKENWEMKRGKKCHRSEETVLWGLECMAFSRFALTTCTSLIIPPLVAVGMRSAFKARCGKDMYYAPRWLATTGSDLPWLPQLNISLILHGDILSIYLSIYLQKYLSCWELFLFHCISLLLQPHCLQINLSFRSFNSSLPCGSHTEPF